MGWQHWYDNRHYFLEEDYLAQLASPMNHPFLYELAQANFQLESFLETRAHL